MCVSGCVYGGGGEVPALGDAELLGVLRLVRETVPEPERLASPLADATLLPEARADTDALPVLLADREGVAEPLASDAERDAEPDERGDALAEGESLPDPVPLTDRVIVAVAVPLGPLLLEARAETVGAPVAETGPVPEAAALAVATREPTADRLLVAEGVAAADADTMLDPELVPDGGRLTVGTLEAVARALQLVL